MAIKTNRLLLPLLLKRLYHAMGISNGAFLADLLGVSWSAEREILFLHSYLGSLLGVFFCIVFVLELLLLHLLYSEFLCIFS